MLNVSSVLHWGKRAGKDQLFHLSFKCPGQWPNPGSHLFSFGFEIFTTRLDPAARKLWPS